MGKTTIDPMATQVSCPLGDHLPWMSHVVAIAYPPRRAHSFCKDARGRQVTPDSKVWIGVPVGINLHALLSLLISEFPMCQHFFAGHFVICPLQMVSSTRSHYLASSAATGSNGSCGQR